MPAQSWLILILLVSIFVLIASDKLPPWVIFVGAITVAMTLQLASPSGLLKGFSNAGVLTVAALFPVATGMYSTGAISLLAQRLFGNPKTETTAHLRILPPVAIGSAFVNNTPVVAMMIPVVRHLVRRGLVAPSLYMGLSFASKLGGSTTLIGSSVNLIVAGMTADAITAGNLSGIRPIGMFDQSWVAVPAAAAGLLYLIYGAPRLLHGVKSEPIAAELKQRYLSEFEVVPASNLEGKSIKGAELISSEGRELRSVRRHGMKLAYSPDLILQGGDKLTFACSAEALSDLWTTIGLVPARGVVMETARHQHELVEVVVSAKASAIGHRLSELPLPDNPYEVMLVGISRHGEAPTLEELDDFRVEPGDGAVFEVNDGFFYENSRESDFLIVKTWEENRVKRADRAIIATAIMLSMITLAASGAMSLLNAALLATFAMLLTGCLTIKQAWGSVQWKTLVVLGAALGLESAIAGSDLSTRIAEICSSVGGRSPRVALAVIFLATMIMTNLIGYAAAVAFMFPVGVSMSEMLGVNFKPFAIILMIAASCSFINPAAFQTNLMVQKDGGYAFQDFGKVGIPLALLVGAVALVIAPIVYGL